MTRPLARTARRRGRGPCRGGAWGAPGGCDGWGSWECHHGPGRPPAVLVNYRAVVLSRRRVISNSDDGRPRSDANRRHVDRVVEPGLAATLDRGHPAAARPVASRSATRIAGQVARGRSARSICSRREPAPPAVVVRRRALVRVAAARAGRARRPPRDRVAAVAGGVLGERSTCPSVGQDLAGRRGDRPVGRRGLGRGAAVGLAGGRVADVVATSSGCRHRAVAA